MTILSISISVRLFKISIFEPTADTNVILRRYVTSYTIKRSARSWPMVTAPFLEPWSRVHQIGAGERLDLLPHPLEPAGVDDRFAHVGQCPLLLGHCGGRLAMQLDRERREIPYKDLEDRIEYVGVKPCQFGLLEDQLRIDDQCEQLSEHQPEVQVLLLLGVRRRSRQQGREALRVLPEPCDVGQLGERLESQSPIGERNLAQAARGALAEQELVVDGVLPGRHHWLLGWREQIVRHELQDQREIDVHRALELGQRADILARAAEVRVALESLGGDDVPQQLDDSLALGSDLHLADRVEQQVPTIPRAGRPEVI